MKDLVDAQIRAMVEVLAAVAPPEGALYVSTPITTGTRFIEWRRTVGKDLQSDDLAYRDGLRRHVIEPNIAAAKPIVAGLRSRGHAVIDPTGLSDIDGWEQQDYHRLWTAVVERYAASVLFVDGWEYSVGAMHEMAEALSGGLQLLDDDQNELRLTTIHARVEAAIADISTDDVIPSGPLRKTLGEIDEAARRQVHGATLQLRR